MARGFPSRLILFADKTGSYSDCIESTCLANLLQHILRVQRDGLFGLFHFFFPSCLEHQRESDFCFSETWQTFARQRDAIHLKGGWIHLNVRGRRKRFLIAVADVKCQTYVSDKSGSYDRTPESSESNPAANSLIPIITRRERESEKVGW